MCVCVSECESVCVRACAFNDDNFHSGFRRLLWRHQKCKHCLTLTQFPMKKSAKVPNAVVTVAM